MRALSETKDMSAQAVAGYCDTLDGPDWWSRAMFVPEVDEPTGEAAPLNIPCGYVICRWPRLQPCCTRAMAVRLGSAWLGNVRPASPGYLQTLPHAEKLAVEVAGRKAVGDILIMDDCQTVVGAASLALTEACSAK